MNIRFLAFWLQVNTLIHGVFSSPESVMGRFVVTLYEEKLQVWSMKKIQILLHTLSPFTQIIEINIYNLTGIFMSVSIMSCEIKRKVWWQTLFDSHNWIYFFMKIINCYKFFFNHELVTSDTINSCVHFANFHQCGCSFHVLPSYTGQYQIWRIYTLTQHISCIYSKF